MSGQNADHGGPPAPGHVDPLLPGYALDALDDTEQRDVAAHLRICPRCRRAAERDRVVAAQIGFAAPRHWPPPDLKHRLMARLAREGMRSPDGHAGRIGVMVDVPPPRRGGEAARMPEFVPAPLPVPRRASRRPARLLIAAALLPWLLALVFAVLLANSARRPAPSLAVAQVAGARDVYGWLVMVPDATTANLMLTHLPPLAADERYVCWLESAGRVDRACVFRPLPRRDAATVMVQAPRPVGQYARITVTIEKGPPAPRHNSALLASGSLR